MDQAELTPALERVAASVVETHRKQQQVEEELKAAAAAVASLHSQSSSLEASVVTLRSELQQALHAKTQEDAALSKLAEQQKAAVDQLADIAREVETFLADKQRIGIEIIAATDAARARLHAVEGEVAAVKTALVACGADATALRGKLFEVVQAANAVSGQIGDVESKARELNTAVDGVAAKVCTIADELDHSDRERQKIATSADELRAVSAALETRRAEAQIASTQTAALLDERAKQTAMLSQQIDRLAQLGAGQAPAPLPATSAAEIIPKEIPVVKAPGLEVVRHPELHTAELVEVLMAQGFVAHDEGASVLSLLAEGDVDKFVRSLWSRAMGGPAPAPYRIIIGTALGSAGDHKGAVTFFNKALEGKSVDPMLTYLVAVALIGMKRYVDVLRLAQALGRTKNGKSLARNIEALHLVSGNRPEEAEQKLVEALSIAAQPRAHYSESMYNLAQLAQRRGDSGKAAMWLEKLAAADPGYRNAALHMESIHAHAHPS